MKSLLKQYQARLASIPPPGGNGCHPALLGAANWGSMAGLDPAAICKDIRRSIPAGSRRVPDREIKEAVDKAVKALVYSGNKSVHASVDVQKLAPICAAVEWTLYVRNWLFRGLLERVGADPATAHPAEG